MTTDKKHDRETVLDAINGTGIWSPTPGENKITHSFGNVTVIAARLGVSRNTVYSYMREWATVDTAIKEGRQTLNDLVENKMAQKMIGGDTTMIIFYAKTQMYDRGYIERHRLEGSEGGPIEQSVTLKVVYENDPTNNPAKEAAPEAD